MAVSNVYTNENGSELILPTQEGRELRIDEQGPECKPTPEIPEGSKVDAGITYEQAYELLKKYNKDDFHLRHGRTVAGLMRYFAKKYDPDNEEFWGIVGMLHDLDWEEWQVPVTHTVKTAELLEEEGVNPKVAHAVQTHNCEYNASLPVPVHKMEKMLWACDELSGLIGATVAMYPSHSSEDLNLKSLKKKFKNKAFAAGCDREDIEKGAALNGNTLDELFSDMIEAYQSIDKEGLIE